MSNIRFERPAGRGMYAERCGEAGSNAVTASALMIYTNPSDEVLRSAHRISFYDPRDPSWYEIVVDQIQAGQYTGKEYLVVDIPMDSSKPDEIQAWRDRIANVRK